MRRFWSARQVSGHEFTRAAPMLPPFCHPERGRGSGTRLGGVELNRVAGVSEAGARRRNPERSRGICEGSRECVFYHADSGSSSQNAIERIAPNETRARGCFQSALTLCCFGSATLRFVSGPGL